MMRAVFLDRDGVLNETLLREGRPVAPTTLTEFRLAPDAGEQAARLRAVGLLCIVFTNQPEVARGLLAESTLAEMHRQLTAVTLVDDIFVCTHDRDDGCDCYKPKPGMLHAAARKWDLDLSGSYVVGDRWRDIDAGVAVGCHTVLIERPYSDCLTATRRVPTLASAVDYILAFEQGRHP
jgi:D-glycero-D-manno-heptose 1,7-bisphosphate phosphatase